MTDAREQVREEDKQPSLEQTESRSGRGPSVEAADPATRDERGRLAGSGGSGDAVHDTMVRSGQDRTLSPSEAWERSERQRNESPDTGVGFRFGEAQPAPGEVDRWLASRSADERQALGDKETVVSLRVSASRPGTEGYNQRLTEERGEALTKEMRDRGVQAEIRVEALGEQEHREATSAMSLRPPSDRDKADRRDDARFRTAEIEIQPHGTQVDLSPEKVAGLAPDRARLKDDLAQGQRIFEDKIAKVLGEKVRTLQPLEENPAAPDPSRDPEKFASQAGEVIIDTLKDLPETAAKFGIGIFLEGARLEMMEKVAEAREPLYRAIAEGVAAGLDPSYGDQSTWKAQNPDQQKLFDKAKGAVEGLSDSQKDELGLFLTQYDTQFETSYDYLTARMEGSSYRGGVTRYFDSDKYYDRE